MGQIHGYREAGGPAADRLTVLRHELANVLNGLAGMARLLKTSNTDAEQEHWLEAIDSSIVQMRFLLRSFGQGEGQARATGVGPFNGLKVLEQLLTAHSPEMCGKGLRPLLVLEPDLPVYWRGEASLIRQLLDNLLCNATKFTDSGDVVVSARSAKDGLLQLSVSDSGPGVPASDRQRIFRVGERGPGAADRPGSGLGLSLCHRIADRLGGEISCGGIYGQGSVFTVTLPGVIHDEDEGRPPEAILEDVYCTLDLDSRLSRSITAYLDRMRVGRGRPGSEPAGRRGKRLVINVSEAERRTGGAWDGIQLRSTANPGVGSIRLQPPVLFTTFQRAMLRQALTWRWRSLSPGDTRG